MEDTDETTAYLRRDLKENILVEPSKMLKKILQTITSSEEHSTGIGLKAYHMLNKLFTNNMVCIS